VVSLLLFRKAVQLRNYPPTYYSGFRAWPPLWVTPAKTGQLLQGEIGRLKEVRRNPRRPCRLFLVMEHEGVDYTGCILFKDDAPCEGLANILEKCCGMSMEDIGSLEVPDRIVSAPTARESADQKHTSIRERPCFIIVPSLMAKI
jgi:hypothetical protein